MFELRQVAASRRVVRLIRPTASPLVGLSWGVKQRGDVRWPFGSSTASAIFGGSEEMPSEFEFRWFTRDLAADRSAELVGTGTIQSADELVDLFRDITREKTPVIIRWRHREALAKIMEFVAIEGLLGEYAPVTLNVQWLEPDSIPAEVMPPKTNPVRDAVRSVLNGYSEILSKAGQPLSMARERRLEFESALVDVTGAMTDAVRLVKAYAGRGSESTQLIGGVSGALAEIGSRAQVLINSVSEAGGALAQVEGSREITDASYFRAVVQRSAAVAWRLALVERLTLELVANGDILEIFKAVEGTDLRILSLKHYGATKYWEEIANFNGISGSVLTTGQKIRVPRRGFLI